MFYKCSIRFLYKEIATSIRTIGFHKHRSHVHEYRDREYVASVYMQRDKIEAPMGADHHLQNAIGS